MPNRIQTKRQIWSVNGDGQPRRKRDLLAVEEPLEIQLRASGERRTVAVTMRTPGNDYELAAGFLHTEGVIDDKVAIAHMVYCVDGEQGRQEYNALAVHLRGEVIPDLPQLERHFFTNSACGVCGRAMLDDLATRVLPAQRPDFTVPATLLAGLPDRLLEHQRIFAGTGGLHAAALFTSDGDLIEVREDVGRHNALDKLIGWGVLNGRLPFQTGIILVSGRASYELLYKCRLAGAAVFCAVSAPSSMAVDLAERFGITLVGFLREGRYNIYSHPRRIIDER